MEVINHHGIQSPKFLDINKIQHRFPEKLKGLNIPVTLLHNHEHCPPHFVLVYEKDFTQAIYRSTEEALKISILVLGVKKIINSFPMNLLT
jgi:hypothetical protein